MKRLSYYYGSTLFCTKNDDVLKIFEYLIDWYRTGQLLIHQSLFDTISLVENLVCTADFQYTNFLDRNQDKNDFNIGIL